MLKCYEKLDNVKGVIRSHKEKTDGQTIQWPKEQTMICKPLHMSSGLLQIKIKTNNDNRKMWYLGDILKELIIVPGHLSSLFRF
jgi:hypothetical protein